MCPEAMYAIEATAHIRKRSDRQGTPSEEQAAAMLMDDPSKRGCALAIMEGATYETVKKQIHPGDSIVLYTDGLYEVEREDGEEFGEERLLAAAQRFVGTPLQTVFPELTNEARLFAEQGELSDDVCLVGLHFKHAMK